MFWQLFFSCQPVDNPGAAGCGRFREAEGIPDPGGSRKAAEQEGGRDDDYKVAQEGNAQGGASLPQAFQCAGTGDGYGGDDKSQADDAQCSYANLDGLCAVCKQADQLPWECPGKGCAHQHNPHGQQQGRMENLPYPLCFPSPGIVSHQGAYALYDSVGG